jgi:hypothetical protein
MNLPCIDSSSVAVGSFEAVEDRKERICKNMCRGPVWCTQKGKAYTAWTSQDEEKENKRHGGRSRETGGKVSVCRCSITETREAVRKNQTCKVQQKAACTHLHIWFVHYCIKHAS